ncbi:MAG: Cytochrome c biogenesis protein CcsA [Phycisphaerales bacterium]|nr:Cytochrome c biogenesis protein CcsA [Phycisphaerales bacterium]
MNTRNPTRRADRSARSLVLIVTATVVSMLLPARATAQTAPAGNEHPQTEAVSHVDGGHADAASPFGPFDRSGNPISTEKKAEFAAGVDLSPLERIAVFHRGRVKILDTLARETVGTLTGKRRYDDIIPLDGTAASRRKVEYDPMFTLLDLVIDPGYYLDKPLMHVEYLPLRRLVIESAFPEKTAQAAAQREWWLKLTRITPRMIQEHVPQIAQQHSMELAYNRALAELDEGISLWISSASNMMLVAPQTKDRPWKHLSTLAADHPARAAALELGSAWRAADAARVNAAAARLAEELPKINAEVYPTWRRSLEGEYNAVRPFEYGYWMYLVATLSLLLAFGTGRSWLRWTGLAALVAAVGLHGFGFISRCIIAERFAIQNQFESMTGISLFAAVVGAALMIARKQWIFGAAAAGVGFLVLITASTTGIPGVSIEREAAILNTSVLLKYHVTTVLVSYGLIALGFILSLFYLGTHYFARSGAAPAAAVLQTAGGPVLAAAALGMGDDEAPRAGRERVLADLDRAHMIVIQIAFWTLGVGILLGAWWADHSWGRWWGFDPKETWALATWIIYLIVIHLRFAQTTNKPLKTAWLSVLGFVVMIWTYFGVNLLLPGLHAYA